MTNQTGHPVVYLMRGLPSCGKSYTARRLAGDRGVVLETDQYFFTQVGDDPARFDYRAELMDDARAWNFQRFCGAVDQAVNPIVVDRGNGRNAQTRQYVCYAMERGYAVQLKEPESAWWRELRVLLKYRPITDPILDAWARRLSRMNRSTHRTPASTIRHWMRHWKHDLTIEQILQLDQAGGVRRAG